MKKQNDLSQLIRECKDGAAGNPYQGTDKKVLFVCSMGILRSATGARLYASRYNTRSAGTYSDALIPTSPLLLIWADEIVFVNHSNYMAVKEEWPELIKGKSRVLDIPDAYPHMDPMLIAAFDQQYERINV